ncbi:quinone-dependent dihydroorotate dehydrogenase [Gryllotalpicola sp.]|uniref:quinone-dependent dihydroorotate dehydrogenase n=1 Tax=Gryllotalpicola sp. TaxID=1932787 RepID=UPI002619BE70|nr:quinone-dependent dihydroorotate dehydrogenase [Gryllotalpicola sp.]
MYRLLFALVFTRIDPERAHRLAFRVLQVVQELGLAPLIHRLTAPRRDISVTALGRRFETPFGLAAGFDKDAKAPLGLWALGFGHVEVGTVTAVPQPGNPRPRLFRLVSDRALINRMGFNNQGAAAAANRLRRLGYTARRPVIGVNIGKSRVVEVEDALADYVASTEAAAPVADYLVVNVSSPNTPGLRGLQEFDRLAPLLAAVKGHSAQAPVLVKIAPDLTDEQVVTIARLAVEAGLAGIVATNTTTSRDGLVTDAAYVESLGPGGLSGAPLAKRSLEVLALVRATVPDGLCIISVGGVRTADDVVDRLRAGATLVQGYTEFIYSGPLWVRAINRGLERLLP